VGNFEEYTWLYQDAWSEPIVRWLLSSVPTVMIFDDHDLEDDWNISSSWLTEYRAQPWSTEHSESGLLAYWIYQHLGNLSPEQIKEERWLDRLGGEDDAGPLLRRTVTSIGPRPPGAGGYRFSLARDLGRNRLVVIDSRHARVLEPGLRDILDPAEWDWVATALTGDVDHLLLATSLPVLLPLGVHYLERWNEAICDGAWGRWPIGVGERLRRKLDLEHWAAFGSSLDKLICQVEAVGSGKRGRPPHSIVFLSGDVHFSYVATARFTASAMTSRVTQLVSSPLRNALSRRRCWLVRLASSAPAPVLGRALLATARRMSAGSKFQPRWKLLCDPLFDNNIGTLQLMGPRAHVRFDHTVNSRASTVCDQAQGPREGWPSEGDQLECSVVIDI
jgi:hypothetical protein